MGTSVNLLIGSAEVERPGELGERVRHARFGELALQVGEETVSRENAARDEVSGRRGGRVLAANALPRRGAATAHEILEVEIEDLAALDAIELSLASGHADGDLARPEAAGQKRREDGAGADAAVDVDVAERRIGQKIRKGAQGAELVKKALDAAARETKGDLAAVAARDRLADLIDDLRESGFVRGGGDGTVDAQPAGLERKTSTPFRGIDRKPELFAPDGAAEVARAKELVEQPQSTTFFEGALLAPRVDDEGVGHPRAELGQKAGGAGLDVELKADALRHRAARQCIERRFRDSGGVLGRRRDEVERLVHAESTIPLIS